EITKKTKIVLNNVAITDTLFFKLMGRTSVTIRNKISLVGHGDYLDRCIGELGWRKDSQAKICFDEYSEEEMKQIQENMKTISKNSMEINAGEIHAVESGIYVILRLFECVDGCIQSLSLKSSKRGYIEEILETESHLSWIAKVKKLSLTGYAVEILSKLRIHEENVMEKLKLCVCFPEEVTEILKEENNTIWVGEVKNPCLK
ncbi:MAG: uncharacterized protein A8A55_3490, partial [Amphiamblys sp. WSBS2006]